MNFGQNLYNWVFKQRTEPCADGDCCYRYLLWDSSVSFPNLSDSW